MGKTRRRSPDDPEFGKPEYRIRDWDYRKASRGIPNRLGGGRLVLETFMASSSGTETPLTLETITQKIDSFSAVKAREEFMRDRKIDLLHEIGQQMLSQH